MNESKEIRVCNIYIILLITFVFIPIAGIFNSLIFNEYNVYILSALFLFYCIYNMSAFSKSLFTRSTIYIFLLFIVYAISMAVPVPEFLYNLELVSLFCYFLFFVLGAVLFYDKEYITDLVWFLTLSYLFAYLARISMDLEGAIEGTNLSSGIVVVSLVPFVLINLKKYTRNYIMYSYVLVLFLMVWCAVIGARAVTLGFLFFLFTFHFWPLITRNRFVYITYFLSCLFFMSLGVLYYIFFITDPDFALLSNSGIGILSKRVGTRLDIWVHLVQVIVQGDWLWGNGSNLKTGDLTPLAYLDFSMNRANLSSHSTIFEVIYRIGVFGLSIFFILIFSIWSFLWKSSGTNLTRIICSSIIMLIPICFSSTFLVFSAFHLRCAFVWILLGFGYGYTLSLAKMPKSKTNFSA